MRYNEIHFSFAPRDRSQLMKTQPINIAICDDHDGLRSSLTGLLETLGEKVTISVGTGKELIAKLKAAVKMPVLCILDVNLPDRHGHHITKELKKNWPDIKIVAFSVNNEVPWEKIMLKAGADVYLRKDINPQLLHEVMKRLCQQ